MTIDLNGHTLTSDYALTGLGRDRYAIVLNNGGKITDSAADGEKGALIVNKARAIGSYNAPLNVEVRPLRLQAAWQAVMQLSVQKAVWL